MALISLRQLLDHAAEHAYGVPAFNVNNLEQMRAIMEAADATDSPVIVQASAGARQYAGAPFLRHLILAAIEEFPHIPVVMHQDHGTSPAVCQRSIQLGFSSVMMDGSLEADGKTPANYAYNVAPKDGSVLLMPPDTLVITELLRPKKAKYKSDRFTFLGGAVLSNSLMAVRSDTGVKTWKDLK